MLAGAPGIGAPDAGYDVDGFVRRSAELSEVTSRAVTAKRLLDSGEMEQRMAQLDSDRKKLIGHALLNFAIGTLQAIELGKHGQALVQQAGISPVELVRILPVKGAIPLLGKVAVDASGFVGGVVKLARAANIGVSDARTGSAPVRLNV